MEIIDDEADRLRALIDNLLDSSRLESGSLDMTREPTRIPALIRDTVSRTQSLYPELELTAEYDDEMPMIPIDATRISQVLDNLISNAVKYAPEAPVAIRARSDEENLWIEIEDEGPGIKPEHRVHLFERFYRVPESSRSARGTGLGLYICRKIIEAHEGEISVESEPGEGTRFFFRIPKVASLEDAKLEVNE